jgi:hypothetical protein
MQRDRVSEPLEKVVRTDHGRQADQAEEQGSQEDSNVAGHDRSPFLKGLPAGDQQDGQADQVCQGDGSQRG